jgi:hypothetical protein
MVRIKQRINNRRLSLHGNCGLPVDPGLESEGGYLQ